MNEEFRKICEQSETLGNISGEYLEYSEKELGVSFPKEYRDFLLEFGALLGNGFEIYGLIPEENQDECPLWQNVVTVTKPMRSSKQAGTDNTNMIPISSDGMETNYFINSGRSDTEIWAITYEEKKLVASSLLEFVKIFTRQEQ